MIKNPTPVMVVPSNAFLIHFMKKSASGMSGVVATAASNPVRITASRRYARETSAEPSKPFNPVRATAR